MNGPRQSNLPKSRDLPSLNPDLSTSLCSLLQKLRGMTGLSLLLLGNKVVRRLMYCNVGCVAS
jgi:uncharacterized protein YejL (UPF0352 family)